MDPVVRCTNCGLSYPEEGVPYRCQNCGGLYDYFTPPPLDLAQVDRSQPGIWRYRHTFGTHPGCEPVSLGEGSTPLVWASIFGRRVAFKCEYFNPSGSFKDRGSTVIVSLLKSRNIPEAIEDSSGNAGASFAAYTARAGIKAQIYIPESASGPKRRQISAYGADLITIAGSRLDVAYAVQKKAEGGGVYASHAYLPFNIPGYATAAYEIFEQLGEKLPGTIVVPAGQGGFLLGLIYGFCQLRIATNTRIPKMIGVQVASCSPLLESFKYGLGGSDISTGTPTLAEGVNVQDPIRRDGVVQAVKTWGGGFYAVDEASILPGRDNLARLGFYVEPTSAIVWSILAKKIDELPDPIVVLLTGSGYKYE